MPVQSSAGAPAAPSKAVVFWRRLGSTLVLWTLVIAGLFSGRQLISNYVFIGILGLLGVSGLIEFYGLVEKRQAAVFKHLGLLAGILLMVGTFLFLSGTIRSGDPLAANNQFEIAFLIFCVLGLCVRHLFSRNQATGIVAIATTLFGLLYVPWLLGFIQRLMFHPGVDGRFYVLFFVLVTKFSDLGAYSLGSIIGRHKMIPRISPGKTWEGFGGAIAVSTLASVLFAWLAGNHLAGMTMKHAVVLGVLLSGTAVIGDLIESLFKREAGVKDSGQLFPGIGGILDLLDSLLFNAPLMYLYLQYVIKP